MHIREEAVSLRNIEMCGVFFLVSCEILIGAASGMELFKGVV